MGYFETHPTGRLRDLLNRVEGKEASRRLMTAIAHAERASVAEGEVAMSGNQILPEEAVDRAARLTRVGAPTTDEMELVYNVKRLDFPEELRLPAERFTRQ